MIRKVVLVALAAASGAIAFRTLAQNARICQAMQNIVEVWFEGTDWSHGIGEAFAIGLEALSQAFEALKEFVRTCMDDGVLLQRFKQVGCKCEDLVRQINDTIYEGYVWVCSKIPEIELQAAESSRMLREQIANSLSEAKQLLKGRELQQRVYCVVCLATLILFLWRWRYRALHVQARQSSECLSEDTAPPHPLEDKTNVVTDTPQVVVASSPLIRKRRTSSPRPSISGSEKIVLDEEAERSLLMAINTLSKEDLLKINGLGPATAEKIMKIRQRKVTIQTLESIGIPKQILSRIKSHYPN